MMFYKMFFSPLSTKEQRKGAEDLLEGNLFAKDGINLGPQVYRSLLETMALYPKKKHYKKLMQHVIQYEDKNNISAELMKLLIGIGIDH